MTTNIVVAGCGAVGSWLSIFLAGEGRSFTLIDDDRIERDNIETTAFYAYHVGALKAHVLGEILYRKGAMVSAIHAETMTLLNARRFADKADLVLDCFDNVGARALTVGIARAVLHVGISRDITGAATWDTDYKVPDGPARGEDTFCTHALGKGIIVATAAIAALIVENYLATGRQESIVLSNRPNIFR